MMRRSVSPGDALVLLGVDFETDVAEILPTVQTPTLVIQRTDDKTNWIEYARYFAQQIPGAVLVELPGSNHGYMSPDQDQVLDQVERFVKGLRAEEAELDRVLATVLFTDIVGSTERAAGLGDSAWRELVERHHATVRAMLARYRGVEVDTAGDGFFATFDGPARAVRCAQAIVEAVRSLGLEVRTGVHTGEVATIDGKVGGIAVSHRRAGGSPCRPWRCARQLHREGPDGRLRPRVRRRRRARAERRPRPLAPLPGGELMGRLDGKVALITGAGSGMGREACVVFASEGARIAALDVDAAGLDATASLVREGGGDIATFVADVADEQQVREAIGAAVERFGALHVLYNNAGVLWRDRDLGVLETDEAVWDRVMAINLKGMVWVCKYGVPELIRAGGGAIVNVGSVSALLGDTIPQDAYSASKGAVISLTRSLAVQFASQGVRANCIHPGFVETPLQTVRTSDAAWVEAARAAIPLGRLGTSRDVVNAALFLASDEASYITGIELIVDGGTMVI